MLKTPRPERPLAGRRFLRAHADRRNNATDRPFTHMIAITITPAAHYAVKASLLGMADATPRPGPDGLIRIWLDDKFVNRLGHMRGPGETYSDVILRWRRPRHRNALAVKPDHGHNCDAASPSTIGRLWHCH
jgi:hypothetical protein